MNQSSSLPSILTILVVSFFAFFINNRVIPADLMESRNLATAQEMVRTGNYLIPTMNGELRLEKPPLPTWVAAGVEHVFPDNLSAQRGAAGVMATLMAIFLFLLVRHLTSENLLALISAMVLVSCFNIIMAGRTATWDIYCHSFMLGAIYFMVRAFTGRGAQWGFFLLAGLFLGLSFLGKGPVSFYALLLPFLLAYGIVMRPRLKGKIVPLIAMILLCVLVCAWWPAYIAVFHPEVGLSVMDKEMTAWINHNVRPIWYYWQFPAEAGVWALFWVSSIIWFFWKKNTPQRQHARFFICWTLAIFVFLSLIPEKKPRYLLPMLIPGSVNIAFFIWYGIKSLPSQGEKRLLRINGAVIGIIALAIPVLIYLLPTPGITVSFVITTILSLAIALLIFKALYNRKGIQAGRIVTGTVALMMIFEVFGLAAAGEMFINDQRHSIRELRYDDRIAGLPLFHDQREGLRIELVYEADKLITPMDLASDSAVYTNLPFVLISTEPISEQLSGKAVSIEYLDRFDNNWRKTDHKRYNRELVKEAAIIRAVESALPGE